MTTKSNNEPAAPVLPWMREAAKAIACDFLQEPDENNVDNWQAFRRIEDGALHFIARAYALAGADDATRLRNLESALVPLMLMKAENCDGQIGWRSSLEAIAGQVKVKHILAAESALEGTSVTEDARIYTDHYFEQQRNAGVINRPQGPCDCVSCRRIRAAIAAQADATKQGDAT